MSIAIKKAFSYLELIIAMSLAVTVIVLATPFVTYTDKKIEDSKGEFRCYSAYTKENGAWGWHLYQQQRNNTASLSDPKYVKDEDGCVFYRPLNATTFNITVIGGGGGGSKPLTDSSIIDIHKIVEDAIDETSGSWNIPGTNAATCANKSCFTDHGYFEPYYYITNKTFTSGGKNHFLMCYHKNPDGSGKTYCGGAAKTNTIVEHHCYCYDKNNKFIGDYISNTPDAATCQKGLESGYKCYWEDSVSDDYDSSKGFSIEFAYYKRFEIKQKIATYQGIGGEAGEVVSTTSDLSQAFNSENIIKIVHCPDQYGKSTGSYNGQSVLYQSSAQNCVAKGGEGGNNTNKWKNYYSLLALYNNIYYNSGQVSKTNWQYVGYGDGTINKATDINTLQQVFKNPANVVSMYNSAYSSNNWNNLLTYLGQQIQSSKTSTSSLFNKMTESTGESGGFTRLRLSNTSSVIAFGGKGGSSGDEISYVGNSDYNNGKNASNVLNVSDKKSKAIEGQNNYYIRMGTEGKIPLNLNINNNKQNVANGGKCSSCVKSSASSCGKCYGEDASAIGGGGGGGGIVYRLAYPLETFRRFILAQEGQKAISDEYSLYEPFEAIYYVTRAANVNDDINETGFRSYQDLGNDSDENIVLNGDINKYYAGNGGRGAGGAIIITW